MFGGTAQVLLFFLEHLSAYITDGSRNFIGPAADPFFITLHSFEFVPSHSAFC